MNKGTSEQLEALLNLEDPITKQHWRAWDKGDCSDVGLCNPKIIPEESELDNEITLTIRCDGWEQIIKTN